MKHFKYYISALISFLWITNACAQSRNGYKVNGITVAGGKGFGHRADQLSDPNGIYVDPSGNVYVADGNNGRVQKWAPGAPEGITVAGDNGMGRAANQLNKPAGICTDAHGNLYIADGEGHRVQKWPPGGAEGITVAGGNGPGGAANQLNYPKGICLDASGNLYVADFLNNRVQKWAPGATEGITVAGGNGKGAGANQFDSPGWVFVDVAGNVYVSDAGNNRVQKWAPGAAAGITVAGGNGKGAAANQLNYPQDIVVDESGNLYVADDRNDRVQKFAPGAPRGITIAGGNGYAENSTPPNKLSGAIGIFLDASGSIYVGQYNSRVQKFEPDQPSVVPSQPKRLIAPQTKPTEVIVTNKPVSPQPALAVLTTLNWLEPAVDIDRLPGGVYSSTVASVPLSVKITSTAAVDPAQIKLLLNGNVLREGDKMRTVDLKTVKSGGSNKKYEYVYSTTVTVPNGKATLQVSYGDDATDVLPVSFTPQGLNLYVLAIGTRAAGLQYPEKDAADFADIFRSQQGEDKLFSHVEAETLTGDQATAAAIGSKIVDWGGKQYGPNDVLFVFISSHGYTEDEKLWITGSDYKTTIKEITSLDFKKRILEPLDEANCKKFIFLDACHSGAGIKAARVDVSDAIRKMVAAGNSTTIITSSSGEELSWENAQWQNGAFTKAIREALTGKKADANGDGIVSMDELFSYIEKRVPELVRAAGETDYGGHPVTQTPKMYNPKGNVSIYVY